MARKKPSFNVVTVALNSFDSIFNYEGHKPVDVAIMAYLILKLNSIAWQKTTVTTTIRRLASELGSRSLSVRDGLRRLTINNLIKTADAPAEVLNGSRKVTCSDKLTLDIAVQADAIGIVPETTTNKQQLTTRKSVK